MSIPGSRWVAWPAAGVALCLAAACSSARPAGGRAVPGAPPATAAPPGAAAPPATASIAGAMNLGPADMPGWALRPSQRTSEDAAAQAALARCAGAPDQATVQVVRLGSPTFGKGHAAVHSVVTLDRSATDARADLSAMESPQLAPCIQRVTVPYLESELSPGTKLSNVALTRLTGGVPDSFAYRLSVSVTAAGQGTAVIRSDTIGFVVGRAEVEINDTTTGGAPDLALEQRLVSLLHARASAAPGTT